MFHWKYLITWAQNYDLEGVTYENIRVRRNSTSYSRFISLLLKWSKQKKVDYTKTKLGKPLLSLDTLSFIEYFFIWNVGKKMTRKARTSKAKRVIWSRSYVQWWPYHTWPSWSQRYFFSDNLTIFTKSWHAHPMRNFHFIFPNNILLKV